MSLLKPHVVFTVISVVLLILFLGAFDEVTHDVDAIGTASVTGAQAVASQLLSEEAFKTVAEVLAAAKAYPVIIGFIILVIIASPLLIITRRLLKRKSPAVPVVQLPAVKMDAFDREFLPAALELFETPPSPIRIAAIWFICLTFATTLLWSYFGWLEIYAVAQGRIQPSGRSKVVQPLEAGKVIAIAVENGSRVSAGDLLLELDSRETGADKDEQARDLESSRAEAARRRAIVQTVIDGTFAIPNIAYPEGTSETMRLRENAVLASDLAQINSTRASLMAQRAEHIATRDRFKASLAARQKLIHIDKEHVDMRELLNTTKVASRAQVIETLQQYEAQVTTQVSETGQLAETEASLVTLDKKLEETTAQFVADQTQKLVEAERKADHLKGEVVKATAKHDRTKIIAPITGTVQQLAVTTQGQVVTSGQSLMTIVPLDAPIEIEAMIQNQDIGFVEPGQPAVVKIESFPYTRFGTINGTVLKVSRDAVDQTEANALSDPKSSVKPQSTSMQSEQGKAQNLVFPATIDLAQRAINVDGKAIPLSPGMSVTVEVRTGQRRAIDYLLSPLREVTQTSGHER